MRFFDFSKKNKDRILTMAELFAQPYNSPDVLQATHNISWNINIHNGTADISIIIYALHFGAKESLLILK
jgi:hypothetical protein